jgi:carboxymethylenebutenolidase
MPLTTVTIQSKNKLGSLPGYINSSSQKAGLVVIQEWWGANDQIKKLAETWFPDFMAIVPDLYRGI